MRRVLWVVPLLLAACGGAGGGAPDAGVFIALQRDFQGFESWEAFPFDVPAGQGDVHLSGPRTVYLNHRPPAGSAEFPVGTILVKEVEALEADAGTPTPHLFAMVKRGGGYNASGAVGWEWFELRRDEATGTTLVAWRGLGPPAGEGGYGSADGTCNSCHAAAAANDFVASPPLQLDAL